MTSYITNDELQGWVGTNNISRLEPAIEAASRAVDDHCGQFFYSSATTLTFKGCGERVGKWSVPIQSITTLKTDDDDDGTFETTWASTDYYLDPYDAPHPPQTEPYRYVVATARTFPEASSNRPNRVQIVGTFGWAAVPAPVKQATLILAARYFKRADSIEGVAGFGEFGVVRISPQDRDVVSLLHPYQAPLVA